MTDWDARLRYWQDVLRLRDWEITLRFCQRAEMPNSFGKGRIDQRNRIAEVILLPEADLCWEAHYKPDTEETLIHELLHIHFEPFQADSEDNPHYDSQEQAINMIAGALLKLERARDTASKSLAHAVASDSMPAKDWARLTQPNSYTAPER